MKVEYSEIMKKILDLIRWIFIRFSGFLSWFFSLIVVSNWNYTFPMIPEEYNNEAKIAICILIFEIFFNKINDYLKDRISKVTCVYSTVKNNFSSDSDLQVSFNDQFAKLYLQINLSGYSKNFIGRKMYLKFPVQVDISYDMMYKDFYEINDEEKVIEIDLSKGFNGNKKKKISDKYVIGVNLLMNQEVIDSSLETEISDKYIDFYCNSVYFKGE